MTRVINIGSPLNNPMTQATKLNPLKIKAMIIPSVRSCQAPERIPRAPVTAYPKEAAPARRIRYTSVPWNPNNLAPRTGISNGSTPKAADKTVPRTMKRINHGDTSGWDDSFAQRDG